MNTKSNENAHLKVLLKNKNFIAVDKMPDLVINSNLDERFSLQKQLLHAFPDEVTDSLKFGFYFPQRLDYATSGVMCVALNKVACSVASSSLEKRTSRKLYLALVRGHVSQPYININIPIGTKHNESEDTDQPIIMSGNGANSRPAESRVVVLNRGMYEAYPASKILLRPMTGRRHQLRVHCQYLGHTIVGDYTYSNRKDVLPPRMFLHSYGLYLPNQLEDVNIFTEDPFTEKLLPQWNVVETWHELNSDTVALLDNDLLLWNSQAVHITGSPSFFSQRNFALLYWCIYNIESAEHEKKMDVGLSVAFKGSIFADQTPTPTTFIRNCEEVGLFQDLINPFEETFRKAAEAVQKGQPIVSEIAPIADDTLHTPNVFPSITDAPVVNTEPVKQEGPEAPVVKTRKYCKRRKKADNSQNAPQYIVLGSNVTFKLPIPILPPPVKVFAQNYFKGPTKTSITPRRKQESASNSVKNEKLESNKMASKRSREKKKHYIAYLERNNEELAAKNAILEERVKSLMKENRQLKRHGSLNQMRDFTQQTGVSECLPMSKDALDSSKNHKTDDEDDAIVKFEERQRLLKEPAVVYSDHNSVGPSNSQRRIFYATLPSDTQPSNTCFLRKPFKKRTLGRKETANFDSP